ncbi:hypothetical protein XAC3218_910004 [Xanthomonas citri pv. citri]|uniref:Uncharacterized protein n=1 Tax=Xanthomonas citri pv. citri TaxID=611301 RepID=A0A0U5FLX2_XANCI|nr:hypothetical protein XAC908_1030004 [Xanthomonas citri pv. citri]CEE55530.1 hypothetical protein XAC3608_1350004 [Xanthomonas citri pv. citri]CEE89059.1 hypothetical protein XAC3218_910004 [Xanthomonas citri pv. citri]CEG18357.1 hypothetical protein XAC3562_840009 [Xanthomonas citri pv. citri]CEH43216.1 hypothetical protein XACLD7_11370005 [Xanthomonas citri pv. citri]
MLFTSVSLLADNDTRPGNSLVMYDQSVCSGIFSTSRLKSVPLTGIYPNSWDNNVDCKANCLLSAAIPSSG